MPGKMVKVSALEALFMMVKVGRRPETLPWDYVDRPLFRSHEHQAGRMGVWETLNCVYLA